MLRPDSASSGASGGEMGIGVLLTCYDLVVEAKIVGSRGHRSGAKSTWKTSAARAGPDRHVGRIADQVLRAGRGDRADPFE